MKIHKTKETFLQNTRLEAQTGCMEWLYHKSQHGYGRVLYQGKVRFAHRLAYTFFISEIPDGLLVRHLCHNPACCNPKHLKVGTQQDNMLDMVKAGRSKSEKRRKPKPEGFAEKLSNAATRLWQERKANGIHCLNKTKLKEDDVLAIRNLRKEGTPFKQIAEMYQVTDTSIRNIMNGRTWGHVL